MQPYFLPYIGYWQLINNIDQRVFFDISQFNKESQMNRNGILYNDLYKEFQLISVLALKTQMGTPIKDVQIYNSQDWAKSRRS